MTAFRPPPSTHAQQSKMAAHTLQLICHYGRMRASRRPAAIFNRFSLDSRPALDASIGHVRMGKQTELDASRGTA